MCLTDQIPKVLKLSANIMSHDIYLVRVKISTPIFRNSSQKKQINKYMYDKTSEKTAIKIVLCKRFFENKKLPVGESNPGLPRDRRGYLPLY